jgi:hypothetical protein
VWGFYGPKDTCVTDTRTGQSIPYNVYVDMLEFVRKHDKAIDNDDAVTFVHDVVKKVRAFDRVTTPEAKLAACEAERDKFKAELEAVRSELDAARGTEAKK